MPNFLNFLNLLTELQNVYKTGADTSVSTVVLNTSNIENDDSGGDK